MSVLENTKFVDYYKLLGVQPDTDLRQIRAAYLQLAKLHHPDAGGSTEVMRQLNDAYHTLVTATSRAAYDMLHSFHTGSSQSQYREVGTNKGSGSSRVSDEYVDFFIDSVFAEYHSAVRPKPSLGKRIKQLFGI